MPPRTTPELVEGVIDVHVDDDLTPFIRTANIILTKVCITGQTYYDELIAADLEQLTEIETWLAAHFYTVLRPRSINEQAGSVQQTLQSAVDLRLNTSHYGQTAMVLDTSGLLAAYNNTLGEVQTSLPGVKVEVGGFWLGTEIEEVEVSEEEAPP